jgi:hypothetical protein
VPRTRPPYPEEFKREAIERGRSVRLHRAFTTMRSEVDALVDATSGRIGLPTPTLFGPIPPAFSQR